jgi:hypothetical protein
MILRKYFEKGWGMSLCFTDALQPDENLKVFRGMRFEQDGTGTLREGSDLQHDLK